MRNIFLKRHKSLQSLTVLASVVCLAGGCSSLPNSSELLKIDMVALPKTTYEVGDEFNVEGGRLFLDYSNDKKDITIPLTLDMITNAPTCNSVVSNYSVEVSYKNKTTYYQISVNEKEQGELPMEKLNPKVLIDIEENCEFKEGSNFDFNIIVNPSSIEYDVYYFDVNEGANTKSKTKPSAPGNYCVLVITKETEQYNSVNSSKFFKITANQQPIGQPVEITNVICSLGGKLLEMGTYGESNTFKPDTKIEPKFITTPKEASNDIGYIIVLNDENLGYPEVAVDELKLDTEYSIHIYVKENSNYFYNGTVWVNFYLSNEVSSVPGGKVGVGGSVGVIGQPMDLNTYFTKVDQKWGVGNNGVQSQNVSIDGKTAHLVAYDDTKTGACLKSKKRYSQGRFEVTLRTTARLGVCTALWLYYNDGPNNHEIDIEMHHDNDIWFTTWLTESNYLTIREKTNYNIFDNQYHTYRFDWYNGSKIEFYVDNVLCYTITKKVPTLDMYIWVGMWYPKDWCGQPLGVTNTLDISEFAYTPFN